MGDRRKRAPWFAKCVCSAYIPGLESERQSECLVDAIDEGHGQRGYIRVKERLVDAQHLAAKNDAVHLQA